MPPDELGPANVGGWGRPSPRLVTLRHAEAAGVATVLAVLGVAAALLAGSAPAAIGVGLGVAAAGLVADRVLVRRVRSWRFAERAEDLLVGRGVAFRRMSVIPYGRMQYVEVTAGPLERAFGLASVQMHTAAAASDARVPGLGAEDAARLRDRLSEAGEARSIGL